MGERMAHWTADMSISRRGWGDEGMRLIYHGLG